MVVSCAIAAPAAIAAPITDPTIIDRNFGLVMMIPSLTDLRLCVASPSAQSRSRRVSHPLMIVPHWAWRNEGPCALVTGGGFHLPVRASLFGAYRRMVRLNGSLGAGSQFASFSVPGLPFWK
jgi:hypothetical protein